jgi:hypothetical protein
MRKNSILRGAAGSTDTTMNAAHEGPIQVAIQKHEAPTLPKMGCTDANIICITGGDFPTRRNVNRLRAISSKRAIVDFVRMKRRVKVGPIALQGMGVREHVCVYKCTAERLRVCG